MVPQFNTEEHFPYRSLVLAFVLTVYLIHTWLDLRQYRAIKKTSPPPSLVGIIPSDGFKKSREYSVDKWWFRLFYSGFDVVQTTLVVSLNILPALWTHTKERLLGFSKIFHHEISVSIAYVLVLTLLSSAIDLPWKVYQTFVLEEKHGFNKQTVGLFISDMVTSLALLLVLMPPLIGAMTWILLNSDHWLPIYLWAFFLVVSLLMMTVYPIAIAPLFNKFEPLEEGSLKSRIEVLASRLDFPLKRLYKMDGSKRSDHSNAFMYGLFNNKRIVLFDTLIKQCNEDEITAIVGHELGHWKMSHNVYNFVAMQLVLLTQFVLFALIRKSEEMFASFGFVDERPVFVSFILFSFISSPMNEIVDLMNNVASRRFEYQADRFAVELGMGDALRSGLISLEDRNKGSLNVDPLYSAYHYSHPPLVERIQAIDKGIEKKN